jgi:cobalamin biosynthesis protein CobT
MAFGLRYGAVSPFNTHVTKLAEALCQGFKVRFVKKMPHGAEALCNFEKCEILLPALDPSKLNETEGQKVYAYSAHERKHAKLTTQEVIVKLTTLIDDAKKAGKTRSILMPLAQTIEDCRIEMNKNYSMPGDMEDLAFCRAIFCENILNNAEFKAKNPIGYIINCFQYQLLSEHPNFTGLGTLPTPPTDNPAWQEMFKRAMKILNDGRFKEAIKNGKSHCPVTLELSLAIEKAWNEFLKDSPQPDPNSEGKGEKGDKGKSEGKGKGKKDKSDKKEEKDNSGSKDKNEKNESEDQGDSDSNGDKEKNEEESEGEGNGSNPDPDKLYDDVSELLDAMNKQNKMDADAFASEMEAIMDEHGILDRTEPSRDVDPSPFKTKVNRDTPYVGFNIHDREVIAKPNEITYNQVCGHVGPQINHVRDMLAVYLKSLTQSRSLRHLRNGKLDQRLFYKTAKGIENKYVFKQSTRGEDFSVAVSIVIDLSGSMGHAAGYGGGASLSPSGLAMQMSIMLAEVFNLLEIPFEIVGFNTDATHGYDDHEYRDREDLGYRYHEFINYWIFKSFDDYYMAGDTRFRLGSITGSGCNVDHEVVYWAAGRLWRRNTKRKLQIVLSDGQPSGYGGNYNGLLDRELVRVNQEIVAAGIEQFAFGLQSTCVKKYYRDFLVLNNLEDLNMEALRMFADYLLQGRTK